MVRLPAPDRQLMTSGRFAVHLDSIVQGDADRPACVALHRLPLSACAEPIWSRELIGPGLPEKIVVSGDGRFVAMLGTTEDPDEGTPAVVLYGPGGRLLAAHSLQLLQHFILNEPVMVELDGVPWLDDTIALFCRDDRMLCIWRATGDLLAVSTRYGWIANLVKPATYAHLIVSSEAASITEACIEGICRELPERLRSPDPDERRAAALAAGAMQQTDLMETLRELLQHDPHQVECTDTERSWAVFPVREAARSALDQLNA